MSQFKHDQNCTVESFNEYMHSLPLMLRRKSYLLPDILHVIKQNIRIRLHLFGVLSLIEFNAYRAFLIRAIDVKLFVVVYFVEIRYIGCISLTLWERVTHICVCNLIIIDLDNGLSPSRCQAIIWTNAEILLIGPCGINIGEIVLKIHRFSFKKMRWKCLENGGHFVSASMC